MPTKYWVTQEQLDALAMFSNSVEWEVLIKRLDKIVAEIKTQKVQEE